MTEGTRVYVEVGGKRTFASAADWPGWSRSGKDEVAALENLAAYQPRYARVTRLAQIEPPQAATGFKVIERLKGNATTDFGAPGVVARHELKPLGKAAAERMVALLDACWKYLDQVCAGAPAALRKGPRGGGRDRDKMFDHVLGAEVMYARALGVRLTQPPAQDKAAVREFRKAIRDSLINPNHDAKWPVPFAARRTAWHALDHAWEIEDRIP